MNSILAMYEAPFMRDALMAGAISGALLGYLGLWIVLRRQVFLGAALPQFAACGAVVAMAAALSPLLGALGGVFAGAVLAATPRRRTGRGLERDAAIGIGYAVASAAVFLVLAAWVQDAHGMHILSGDILCADRTEIVILAATTLVVALLHAACWKRLVLVSYDPEAAGIAGLKVRAWDLLLMGTIGAGVAASLRTSGAILSFAALVGPAVAALLVARRLSTAVILASSLGALMAALGLTISYLYELPSGPTMALAALLPMLPSIALRALVVRNAS